MKTSFLQLDHTLIAEGSMDFADSLAVLDLHETKKLPSPYSKWWAFIFWTIVLGTLIGVLLSNPWSIFGWIGLVIALLVLFLQLLFRWHQRRSWATSPLRTAKFHLQISEDGIKTTEQFHDWEDFKAFCDSDDLLLLYLDEARFLVILKRWFKQPSDWDCFLQYLGHSRHIEMLRR